MTVLTKAILKSQPRLQKDKEKVRSLKNNPKTDKIQFQSIDLSEHFLNSQNVSLKEFKRRKRNLFKDIKELQPTVIVLPFTAAKFLLVDERPNMNIVERINSLNETSRLDEIAGINGADIVNVLRTTKPYLWQKNGVVVANDECLIFQTRNMFQTKGPLMTSNTKTTNSGFQDSIPVFLDNVKYCVGSKVIKVLMFSGSHSLIDGISAFSRDYDKNENINQNLIC